MRVGQRLFLTVVPAVLGCFTVVGLAYWGQYGNVVPRPILAVALVLAVGSLVVSWWNARYVASRIERVAGPGGAGARHAGEPVGVRPPGLRALLGAVGGGRDVERDEIDAIERVVDTLSDAVTTAEATRARAEAASDARVAEYASLLATATSAVTARLAEIRMPLHILLEDRFGDLNENQEEMLDAARVAADAADEALGRLRRIVDLDRGAVTPRREAVALGDLLPTIVRAAGSRRRARDDGAPRITLDVEPALPRVRGDLTMLHDALTLVVDDAAARAPEGGAIRVVADLPRASAGMADAASPRAVCVDVAFDAAHPATDDLALARRLVEAHGGTLVSGNTGSVVRLPLVATPSPRERT